MLKLHNTLTKQLETFTPIAPPHVGFYSCGPTVYNYPHIGNYRAYVFADILKRVLMRNGFEVTHIMNITDVDDKTIRDAQKDGSSLTDFTERYTQIFFDEIASLNILPADTYPRATDYINDMVSLIETLLDKGHAYRGDDGSVYYKIDTFKTYGRLAGLSNDELKENASGRIKNDEYDKDSPSDFALWKAWDESDGDVYWETSLGKGRPGWHIECSAMSMKHLGESFDIHTGGIDNIFPHHDNEIAQSEGCTGEHFVNYWLHNGWLLVDGKKMSKSAGNFYTLKDIVEKGYTPLAYRYLLLGAHYRTPLNFTWDSLDAARSALTRLTTRLAELPDNGTINTPYQTRFNDALNDDLGTPQALATVWELLKDAGVSDADKKATILSFDDVLGLNLGMPTHAEEIPPEIIELVERREASREAKDWSEADNLRTQIQDRGFDVDDRSEGPYITRK